MSFVQFLFLTQVIVNKVIKVICNCLCFVFTYKCNVHNILYSIHSIYIKNDFNVRRATPLPTTVYHIIRPFRVLITIRRDASRLSPKACGVFAFYGLL